MWGGRGGRGGVRRGEGGVRDTQGVGWGVIVSIW